MITHSLHLKVKRVANGFYDVSVCNRPDLVIRAVSALDEMEAKLRAAAGLAFAFVTQDQELSGF